MLSDAKLSSVHGAQAGFKVGANFALFNGSAEVNVKEENRVKFQGKFDLQGQVIDAIFINGRQPLLENKIPPETFDMTDSDQNLVLLMIHK